MNKKILLLGVVLIMVSGLFNSCTETKKTDLFSTIIKNDSGDFRGLTLNSKKGNVKRTEDKNALTDETEESLEYEYKMNKDNSFDIICDFDEQGLYSIDIQTYLYNDNDQAAAIKTGQDLYQKFFDYFSKKFGQPEKVADKSYSWSFKPKSGKTGEIQLIDNSDLDNYGSVNIIVETVE